MNETKNKLYEGVYIFEMINRPINDTLLFDTYFLPTKRTLRTDWNCLCICPKDSFFTLSSNNFKLMLMFCHNILVDSFSVRLSRRIFKSNIRKVFFVHLAVTENKLVHALFIYRPQAQGTVLPCTLSSITSSSAMIT